MSNPIPACPTLCIPKAANKHLRSTKSFGNLNGRRYWKKLNAI
ncbi:MAG TPA: hypothetical protein PK079_18190 [Leptospiraceae bacterium]|nr:hypothetical protein [Leptospiraceae bacterium]HMX33631.1 hypothetical protein [Leptospiraceae bacterium]HMZ64852.1 hypothetical protein [Leptospiraceae bacterium]HNE55110.1 hypothetical protein [Leptospiraceae bacterium]HNH57688.1 hypothetical protein [Leptospiraceae bacterium]